MTKPRCLYAEQNQYTFVRKESQWARRFYILAAVLVVLAVCLADLLHRKATAAEVSKMVQALGEVEQLRADCIPKLPGGQIRVDRHQDGTMTCSAEVVWPKGL